MPSTARHGEAPAKPDAAAARRSCLQTRQFESFIVRWNRPRVSSTGAAVRERCARTAETSSQLGEVGSPISEARPSGRASCVYSPNPETVTTHETATWQKQQPYIYTGVVRVCVHPMPPWGSREPIDQAIQRSSCSGGMDSYGPCVLCLVSACRAGSWERNNRSGNFGNQAKHIRSYSLQLGDSV